MGRPDVRGMLGEIDSHELQEWVDYFAAEPWGEVRADQRAAAQALWITAPFSEDGGNLPELTFPYFRDEQAQIDERMEALEKRAKVLREAANDIHTKPNEPLQ